MSLQHIQKNSPGLLPKPAKFEKNPPSGYRVIRKTKCGAAGAGSSPIHKQASLAGRLILDKRVLIATDNATVVSYLNKQGGTHSWDMCLLVWRILAYCNPRNILIRARHIQGCLNVIADSLSRKDKIIQTEWSLHPQIFSLICKV